MSQRFVQRSLGGLAALSLLGLFGPPAAHAQYFWVNNGSGNFSSGFAPSLTTGSSSASLTFIGSGAAYTATDDLTAAVTLNSLSIGGNFFAPITLARGTGGANNTLIFAGSNPSASLSTSSIALDLRFNAMTTFFVSDLSTLSGTLSGNFGFTKTDFGTLVLTGNSVSAGTITVSSGTVQFGDGTTNGTPTTGAIVNNSTVAFNPNASGQSFGGRISGSGTLSKIGAGTLTLTNANSYSGGTVVSGGTLRSGSSSALSTSAPLTIASGATMDLNNFSTSISSLSGSGSFVLGSAALTATQSDDTVFAGVISGSGRLTMNGIGTLTLTGTNTYSGGTTVNLGTLAIGAPGALPSGSSVTINGTGTLSLTSGSTSVSSLSGNGGTLNIGGGALFTTTQSVNTSFNGAFTGAGNLAKTGAGTLTLTGNSTNTGTATVSAGALVLSGGSSRQGFTIGIGSSLSLTNGVSVVTGGGAGTIRANSGATVTYNNATVTGGYLSGAGSHSVGTGGATFNNLAINATSGVNVASGGNLNLNNVTLLTSLNVAGTSAMDGVLVTSAGSVNITNTTTASTVSNLEVDGKLNIATGAQVNNTATSLTMGGGSQLNIGTKTNQGGTLDLGNQTLELNGAYLVNNGTIQNGLVNINYGATAKGAGTYAGGYSVNYGGKIVFGNSPGTLHSGSATWNDGGGFAFQINDASGAAGTNWGLNDITGSLSLVGGSSPFTISLQSFLAGTGDVAGTLANFDSAASYSWAFVTTTDGITGFDADFFSLDTSGFTDYNPQATSDKFQVVQNGNTLRILYNVAAVVPESSTLALVLPALAVVGAVIIRQKGFVLPRRKIA